MKTASKILTVILLVTIVMSMAACGNKVDREGLWENATYVKDTTVGDGEKTVKCDVVVGENSITITVKTDAATFGEALYENELINDPSFFDTCNGIKADWNKDQAYWAFYNGENYMDVGVDKATISGGEHYRLVYTQ